MGSLISQYLIFRGYSVCIIDNRTPAFYGYTRARFHQVDLLCDPIESIIPHYLRGKHIVVLNVAMVRTPENGGSRDSDAWNSESQDRNPLFALNVINACNVSGAIIDAVYYVSTLSIFDIGYYRDHRLIMPEYPVDHFAIDGYGVGKWLGEYLHELAVACGLLFSAGSIRLSTPRLLEDCKLEWVHGGYAYILFEDDCVSGVERIITQKAHPIGYRVYQLDSLNPSVVELTAAQSVGYKPSFIWK